MYKNQYIVVGSKQKLDHLKLSSVLFGEFLIYSHPNLNVSIAKHDTTQIAVIGYVINPLAPHYSNDEITETLARTCPTAAEFLKEINVLSGRYVILYKNGSSFLVVGDACHLRQIFFGTHDENLILTSSPKLFLDAFNLDLRISKEKEDILDMPFFIKEESTWYGDETLDDRLTRLLPNCYLDVQAMSRIRIPFFSQNFTSDDQIIKYAGRILKNTFLALDQRFNIIQPLTAGLDSRILLAASKEVSHKIQYYVFDMSGGKGADVWVPTNLSNKFDLGLKVVKSEPLQDDFLEKFKKENIFPRILPKTTHIQYHYNCMHGPDVINVNGNCSEIARFVYGHTKTKTTLSMLLTFSKYQGKIPYFDEQLKKWYFEAEQYAVENGISLLDLFYWEQRMGNWHALWQFEQDIAVEEVSPFNNRSLIIALLQANPNGRKSPGFSFYKKLIDYLWAETLSEPINPDGNYFRKLIKGNSAIRYVSRKIRAFFRR